MKIAIQGHLTKGKEVIQVLENLGGVNSCNYVGNNYCCYYEIHGNTIVCACTKSDNYKYYTLEEFKKEFPFKIGDKVVCKATQQILHTIVGISWDSSACMQYEIKEDKTGIITHCPTNLLIKYKEMKEERNITLTLDKAKEWYSKGGELKEVALQAYSEEELTKIELPKTWEEFCENYPMKGGMSYIDDASEITTISSCTNDDFVDKDEDKNLCPSKKSAEAHLALIQLEQLRDCYRQGDIPDFNDNNTNKYCITKSKNHIIIEILYNINRFLSFTKKEVAEEFLTNFKPLIEIAEDYI